MRPYEAPPHFIQSGGRADGRADGWTGGRTDGLAMRSEEVIYRSALPELRGHVPVQAEPLDRSLFCVHFLAVRVIMFSLFY